VARGNLVTVQGELVGAHCVNRQRTRLRYLIDRPHSVLFFAAFNNGNGHTCGRLIVLGSAGSAQEADLGSMVARNHPPRPFGEMYAGTDEVASLSVAESSCLQIINGA